MEDTITQTVQSMIAGTSALIIGIPSFWYFLTRITVKNAIGKTEITAADASTGIIDILHGELKRLNEANTELTLSLSELRTENYNLRAEIAELQITVNQLTESFRTISRDVGFYRE